MSMLSKRHNQEIVRPDNFSLLSGELALGKRLTLVKDAKDTYTDDDQEDSKVYINGIANANIIDRVDERLEPTGLDIKNYIKNKILLADHMYWTAASIGQVEELRVEDSGVHFDAFIGDSDAGQLTQMQKDVRSLVRQRILKTVSVGFIPHKIKAPEFDDRGNLVEPAVVEAWELLELSVVAVPCNPLSTFEERGTKKGPISLNTNQNSDSARLTSKADPNHNNVVKDNTKQDDPTINSKKGNDMDEKTAQELVDGIKNMNTLLTSLNGTVERSVNLNETILSHLEAKGSNKPKEDDEDMDKDKDKEKSFDAKSAVEDLQKQVNEIVDLVKTIAEKVASI